MLDHLVARAGKSTPIEPLTPRGFSAWTKAQSAQVQAWVKAAHFSAKPGSFCLLPDGRGRPSRVLVGVEDGIDRWSLAVLPGALPTGIYRLPEDLSAPLAEAYAFAWAMGCYRFGRYKSKSRDFARLLWPKAADRDHIRSLVTAIGLARDLINTPAEDMGPPELAAAIEAMARDFGAKIETIVGEDLLARGFNTIHAVGRAAAKAPRLVDLSWGESGPSLVLIGKGVCFDSGGLDLKSAANMLMMKKDMGGAASVIALAQMIMKAKLDLRLRLLVPIVENAVSGNAYRPWDVIRTKKGITVEIGNTDAEGRLILCDALAEADRDKPDLMIDMATLTGAARVALGPDLPALFANDDDLAEALLRHGRSEDDPLWRLPLWKPYRRMLDSKVADIGNCSDSSFAGSITAALYLAEFVSPETKWMHIDTMAWVSGNKPGRPDGGEPLGLRALFAFIRDWRKIMATKSAPKIITRPPAPRALPKRIAAKRPSLRRRK